MALKFDESTGYYAIPDDAALSLPAGDWCIGAWVKITDNTGDFFQYLFSNGGFLATSSLNFYIGEDNSGLAGDRGRWLLALKSDDGTTIQLGAQTTVFGADNTWRIVLVQYNSTAGAWELWTCAKDGTAELLASTVSAAKTVNGGAWNIGGRVDGNADRYFGEHACEFWVGNNFSLTQAEIEDLATGKRIIDIGKSPALYYPAETADATLSDLGTSGLTATRNGTVTTSIEAHPVTEAPEPGEMTISVAAQAQNATASISLSVDSTEIGIEGNFDQSNVNLATSSVSGSTVTLNPRLTTTEGDSNKWGFWMARLTNVNGVTPIIEVPEANNYLGVSNRAVWSYDRVTWQQFDNGSDIGTHRRYSNNTAFNQDTVYVAKMEPFSETEMSAWLTANDANQYLHETGSSTSFGGDKYQFNLTRTGDTDEKGDPVPQYKMHTFRISNDAQAPDDGQGKRRCVIWGGVHAGETSGSHAAIGFANYLLAAGDAVAQRLLKNFEFFFVPIVNASGRGAGHFRGTFENNLNTNREIGNNTIDVVTKAENALIVDTGGTCHVGLDFHGWKGTLYQGYWDHDSASATKWTDKLGAYTSFGTSGTQGAGGMWHGEYARDVMGASFANTPEIGEDSVSTLTQMRVWGEHNARVIDDLWLDNELAIIVTISVLAAAQNATCGLTLSVEAPVIYEIEHGPVGGPYVVSQMSEDGTDLSYLAADLTADTLYEARARAYDTSSSTAGDWGGWVQVQTQAVSGVTITADPLITTATLSGASIISAQVSAQPLVATTSLSAQTSTSVNVSADPLSAATSLSADQHISAAVTSDPLTVVTSLGATSQISVTQAADPLIVATALAGASVISVNQVSDPLTATTALSADIQAGGGVTINAQPLTVTTSLSASAVISVLQSADPIVVSSALLADAYVNVNVTADILSAETALFGTVQAAGGVHVTAAPLTLAGTLTGQAITGVNVVAVPLSLIASISASTVIGVNQSASPLTLTASLLGNVIAGAVVINIDAAETLHLAAENPTLNLTAESPTLNLTP